MSNSILKLNAIPIEQNGKKFYLFTIDAKTLLEISHVKRRTDDPEEGIQRKLEIHRCKDIAEYIDFEEGVLANSILINFYNDKAIYNENTGCIEFRKDSNIAIIIDGQHRLKAFDFSSNNDFQIPVSGFIGLSLAEIAEIFVRINYYQKSVNKSLVFDLLGISPDLFPDYLEAHQITKTLNENMTSPWYGLIKMLGVGKGIITQATFIKAMEDYKVLQDTLGAFTLDEKTKILSNYFQGMKNIFPEKWGNKNSVLSKSVCVNSFFKLFPEVFNHILEEKKKFILKDIESYLLPLKNIDVDDSELSSIGGKKGVNTITEKMKKELRG